MGAYKGPVLAIGTTKSLDWLCLPNMDYNTESCIIRQHSLSARNVVCVVVTCNQLALSADTIVELIGVAELDDMDVFSPSLSLSLSLSIPHSHAVKPTSSHAIIVCV